MCVRASERASERAREREKGGGSRASEIEAREGHPERQTESVRQRNWTGGDRRVQREMFEAGFTRFHQTLLRCR